MRTSFFPILQGATPELSCHFLGFEQVFTKEPVPDGFKKLGTADIQRNIRPLAVDTVSEALKNRCPVILMTACPNDPKDKAKYYVDQAYLGKPLGKFIKVKDVRVKQKAMTQEAWELKQLEAMKELILHYAEKHNGKGKNPAIKHFFLYHPLLVKHLQKTLAWLPDLQKKSGNSGLVLTVVPVKSNELQNDEHFQFMQGALKNPANPADPDRRESDERKMSASGAVTPVNRQTLVAHQTFDLVPGASPGPDAVEVIELSSPSSPPAVSSPSSPPALSLSPTPPPAAAEIGVTPSSPGMIPNLAEADEEQLTSHGFKKRKKPLPKLPVQGTAGIQVSLAAAQPPANNQHADAGAGVRGSGYVAVRTGTEVKQNPPAPAKKGGYAPLFTTSPGAAPDPADDDYVFVGKKGKAVAELLGDFGETSDASDAPKSWWKSGCCS